MLSSSFSFSWTWIFSVFILVSFLVLSLHKKKRVSNLPPGPKGLPILGNFLMLRGKLPHHDLQRLSNQHGPIMYLRMGSVPTIVVSSPQAAELFLKTYDLIFASRPFSEAANCFTYGRKDLAWAEYGSYWRGIRRLCHRELLSSPKVESFKTMRREEVKSFVESLKDASSAVDISDKVMAISTDMSFRMILGSKYTHSGGQHERVNRAISQMDSLSSVFNIADYYPCLGGLDLQRLAKRMEAVSRNFDDILEKILDEHLNVGVDQGHTPDFVDLLLSSMDSKENEVQIDRSNIKAILLDMLSASIDTTATTIDWAFSELLKHPSIMKKAREEIQSFVGMDRMVDESDLVNLEYLDMVIKETFRLHPAVPLLIPHESTEDCTVTGYHIPEKSRIIINTWSIGRDPDAWDDAEEFRPERFAGKNIDYIGLNFEFLPFGSGRRRCPGIQLGLTMVRLVLAQLVHCFDWELSNGMLCTDISMDEEFRNAVVRANNLSVIPTYRLSN